MNIKKGDIIRFSCYGRILETSVANVIKGNLYDYIECDHYKIIETIDYFYKETSLYSFLGEYPKLRTCYYKKANAEIPFWFADAQKFEKHIKNTLLQRKFKRAKEKHHQDKETKINWILSIVELINKQGFVYFHSTDGGISGKVACNVCYMNGNFYVRGINSYTSLVKVDRLNKSYYLKKEDAKC